MFTVQIRNCLFGQPQVNLPTVDVALPHSAVTVRQLLAVLVQMGDIDYLISWSDCEDLLEVAVRAFEHQNYLITVDGYQPSRLDDALILKPTSRVTFIHLPRSA